MLPGDSMLTPTCSCLQHLVGLTCFCLRTKNRARKTYVFANAGSEVMLGWGGVGMLTFFLVRTLDIATLQRSLVSLLRYMLLRCEFVKDVQRGRSTINAIQARLMLRGPAANNSSPTLWVPGTKMSCYMPKCGNGDSSASTRNCLRRLQKRCEWSSEKDAWIGPIEIAKKITFYCSENTISPKNTQIWTSNLALFKWHKWLPRCGKTHILL